MVSDILCMSRENSSIIDTRFHFLDLKRSLIKFLAILFCIELSIFTIRSLLICRDVQSCHNVESVYWGTTTLINLVLESLHVDWLFYGVGGVIAFVIYHTLQERVCG
jgi:hypothetical protein